MDKKTSRLRRAKKARSKIRTLGVNRLSVHRTPRHIYAQITTPDGAQVLASASSVLKDIRT
jgi:large subunit ribosomal protein L18